MSIPSDNLSKEEMKMSRIGRLPVVIPGGVTVDVKIGRASCRERV